jgi:hypothetical protein
LRAPDYRTHNYERNHSETNRDQTNAVPAITGSEVISRGLSRSYFASEKSLEFAIEALLFAIIMAISAWPIFAAADALNEFLQRVPS